VDSLDVQLFENLKGRQHMPQDTSIYWKGSGELPPEIIPLTPEQHKLVVAAVLKQQYHTQHDDATANNIIGFFFVLLFFVLGI
jgi:hypothetical protein